MDGSALLLGNGAASATAGVAAVRGRFNTHTSSASEAAMSSTTAPWLRWESPAASIASCPYPRRSTRAGAQLEGRSGSAPTEGDATEEKPVAVMDAGVCAGCGKPQKVGGCNGEGRIQGGIGAFPGFGWWPIKAFRPCPAYLETGGRYRRAGQSLEEVAFGRKGSQDDMDVSERFKG